VLVAPEVPAPVSSACARRPRISSTLNRSPKNGYCLGADGSLDTAHPEFSSILRIRALRAALVDFSSEVSAPRDEGCRHHRGGVCDNLVDNGVLGVARTTCAVSLPRSLVKLHAWIEREVTFLARWRRQHLRPPRPQH